MFVFANDERPGRQLEGLRREIEGIRRALGPAEREGLCEVVVRESTTAEEFIEVIEDPRYRARLALVHFAGHASGSRLQLEGEGEPVAARIQGLAPLLAELGSLALVVLNGCSTIRQGRHLVVRGIPAVVATEHTVEDQRARRLAVDFYRSVAAGEAISTAFERAIHQAECFDSSQGPSRDLAPAPRHEKRTPPWTLLLSEPEDDAKAWSLPRAANEPLFGVPEPREGSLPQEPFMGLRRFTARDSAVFFGRGQAIRNLYDDVTAATIPHVLVVYGASGVGKSSLLEAGLLPRLAVEHEVHALRLERGREPVALLRQALGGDGEPVDLVESWLAKERATRRPVVVCIDQLEHLLFDDQGGESLARFVGALGPLFEPGARPRGKLLLSLRKEWFPELLNELRRQGAQWHEHFVEPLDRDDIREVVLGPTRTTSLRTRYGITCEAGLAARIADDLLGDRESAVAPVLQILLTRMWARADPSAATAGGRTQRRFTIALYDELRREGLALRDFVDRQLESLNRTHGRESSSGLVLDLLYGHTTARGTAADHTYTELARCYAHRWPDVRGLIERCVSLYLLLPVTDRRGGEIGVRLAHDTLAPIIRDRYQGSKAPGQAAARLLRARIGMGDLSGRSRVLGEHDLEQVEAARAGMRRWTDEEQQLVAESRRHRTRVVWERRARWLVMIAAVVVAVGALALRPDPDPEVIRSLASLSSPPGAALEPPNADDPTSSSTMVPEPADREDTSGGPELEAEPTDEPETAALAAQTTSSVVETSPARPLRAGARVARRPLRPPCEQSSHSTELKNVGTIAVSRTGQRVALADKERKKTLVLTQPAAWTGTPGDLVPTQEVANHLAWSPDEDVLALGQRRGKLKLVRWEGGATTKAESRLGHDHAMSALAFSAKGDALLSADRGGLVIVWRGRDHASSTQVQLDWKVAGVRSLSGSKWLLAGSGGHLGVWDGKSSALSRSMTSPHANRIWGVGLLPGARRVLAAGSRLQLWDLDTTLLSDETLDHVAFGLHVLEGGEYVLTIGKRSVDLWHWKHGELTHANSWSHDRIDDVAVLPKFNEVFALDSTGEVHRLVRKDEALTESKPFTETLSHSGHIVVDPEGRYLVVGHGNGSVTVVPLDCLDRADGSSP